MSDTIDKILLSLIRHVERIDISPDDEWRALSETRVKSRLRKVIRDAIIKHEYWEMWAYIDLKNLDLILDRLFGERRKRKRPRREKQGENHE